MAGDWIKMRSSLYRDPKVCIMADMLDDLDGELARFVSQNRQRDMTVTRNVTRNAVVGALVSIWGVLRHRGKRDGDDLVVRGATVAVLDDIADLPGIGEAMEAVGWAVDDHKSLRLPNFYEDFNIEPSEESREKNRLRQQRFREQKRNAERNVTVAPQSNAREEKRREEKDNTPPPPSGGRSSAPSKAMPPIPEPLASDPAFVEAWGEWTRHRREKRATLTPTAARRALAKLAKLDPAEAVAMLEHSTAQGYTGLYGPNGSANGTGRVDENNIERNMAMLAEIEREAKR